MNNINTKTQKVAVLNFDDNEVYIIDTPLDKRIASLLSTETVNNIEVNVISKHDAYDLTADNHDIELDDEPAQFFSDLCSKCSGYGTYIMHDNSYKLLYEEAVSDAFTLKTCIEEIGGIVNTWQDGNAKDVLDAHNIEYDDNAALSELNGLAVDAIMNSDWSSWVGQHEITDHDGHEGESVTMFVYSMS